MKLKQKLAEEYSDQVRHHYDIGVESVFIAGFNKAMELVLKEVTNYYAFLIAENSKYDVLINEINSHLGSQKCELLGMIKDIGEEEV